MSNIRIPQFPNDGFIKISRPDDQYKIEVSDTPDNCPGERRSLENDIETKKKEIAQLQIQIQEVINRAQANEVALAAARAAAAAAGDPAALAAAEAARDAAVGAAEAARDAALAAQAAAVADNAVREVVVAANQLRAEANRELLEAQIAGLQARIQQIHNEDGEECARLENEIDGLTARIVEIGVAADAERDRLDAEILALRANNERILEEDGIECERLERENDELRRNHMEDFERMEREFNAEKDQIIQENFARNAVVNHNALGQANFAEEKRKLEQQIESIHAENGRECERLELEIYKYRRALFNISITKNSSHKPTDAPQPDGAPCKIFTCNTQNTIDRIKAYAKSVHDNDLPEKALHYIEKKNQTLGRAQGDEILTDKQKQQARDYGINIVPAQEEDQ
jgi:hypothetical protein